MSGEKIPLNEMIDRATFVFDVLRSDTDIQKEATIDAIFALRAMVADLFVAIDDMGSAIASANHDKYIEGSKFIILKKEKNDVGQSN